MPSTYAANGREMKRLLRAFDGSLPKLTTVQIEKYKVQRSQTVKASTVNRELALLKHMPTKAADWGYLKQNPARTVKLLKEPPGRLRYLEAEDIARLLAHCDDPQTPYLQPIVMVALHTGMRSGETIGLRCGNLDLRHRLTSITKTKNNDRKTIPINEILYEKLANLPRHMNSPFPLCHPDGPRILRIDRSFHSTLSRAGIEGFRFHDLRHTFASRLAVRGVSLGTIGALLGHKDPKMTKRYPHPSPITLQEAVTALQDLQRGNKREYRGMGTGIGL
jgi:integrase